MDISIKEKNRRIKQSIRMMGNKIRKGILHTKSVKDEMSRTRKGRRLSRATIDKIIAKQSGEKSHFWKGGLTNLNELIRQCFEYKLWRKDVFVRDDFTCQECKARSGHGKSIILQAEHIKPLAIIIREENIKSLPEAISCKVLWDRDNGKTLCIDCHRKTDTYGYKIRKYLN